MTKARKKKKQVVFITITVIALSAIVLLTAGIPGGRQGGSGGPPGGMPLQDSAAQQIVVDVTEPKVDNLYVTGEFAGMIEAGQSVTVYPKVSGQVQTVNFDTGDSVEAGAVLFTLDSTTLQYSIRQSHQSLAVAEERAALNLEIAQQAQENYDEGVEEGKNSSLISAESSVATAENAVSSASNTLSQARSEYREYRDEDGDEEEYTDNGLDQLRNAVTSAEYALERAQLQMEQAELNLEAVKKEVEERTTSNQNSVRTAELNANLQEQYIALERQQNELADYTIIAPISGVIEQRNVEPYNMASTQGAAYVIANKDAMEVTFSVAETALANMQVGDNATIKKNGDTCTASISEIGTVVDSANGLFPIHAIIENAPFELYTGSTVKVTANTKKAENAIIIPIDSVYYESGAPFVYLYENGTAVKTSVEVGISDGTDIQVISGISVSDTLISTWSADLADGAEVVLLSEVSQADGNMHNNGPGQRQPGDGPEAASYETSETDTMDDSAAESGENQEGSSSGEEDSASSSTPQGRDGGSQE